jgi:hypothetical protein
MKGAPGLLIFAGDEHPQAPRITDELRVFVNCELKLIPGCLVAGNRLVSHRRPHVAALTAQTVQPLAELGEKVKYFEVTILSVRIARTPLLFE